ncbi:Precorrin-2 oxidase @ Sirohydrochlorin ferrochelatase activity of CysG / Uroporphyrinogen-III methyltransferase [hydrothermal vent metagenome]|uniref:Precorrin-2 oxidase @ Sirohydrochlorin ferrochelatase activity of CysG / Uroporphyrinogen-III methyltransferase n=1 Tax=hydrothermal vent metagenome TaxID=652676 RepID=A0A3B0Y6E0_9ZZZZ
MQFLPIFMKIKDRPCLIVGGGDVAARKALFLLEAGANLRVIAPQFSSKLDPLRENENVELIQRQFLISDLEQCTLVIAATDQTNLNKQISEQARSLNIPVNVVDNPSLCSFIVPSIIDRSPVQIAVSTGGSSPVLARMLRTKLEASVPAAYGQLGKFAEKFRELVKQSLPDVESRRRFWEKALEGPVAELIFAGKEVEAERRMGEELARAADDTSCVGEVYLVGAGPGDPDLLTFRAIRLMQQAEVVVYDRLVSKEVMALCRRDADRIYVGKERDNHTVPQEDINHLLVRLAKEGKRVCRLKGGDPFIFGRGGEEIDTLAEEGISFQVVPGITAASGTAAYAGIPLTHRDYSQAVVFTTGHLKDGTTNINWPALAQPNQTIVFYMGLHGLEIICSELMAHGMSKDMPIAMVQQATTPNQKVVTGTLDTMVDKVKQFQLKPPTLIIVGEVVTLQEKLSWFHTETENE